MNNTERIKQMENQVMDMYRDLHPRWNVGHIKSVMSFASELAAAYLPDKVETCRLAALLHDIGRIRDNRKHCEQGAAVLDREPMFECLPDFHLIRKSIIEHSGYKEPTTDVSRIVNDADREHYPDIEICRTDLKLTSKSQFNSREEECEAVRKKLNNNLTNIRTYFDATKKSLKSTKRVINSMSQDHMSSIIDSWRDTLL